MIDATCKVTVPAAKGFYALLYYVPRELDAKGKTAWASVVAVRAKGPTFV